MRFTRLVPVAGIFVCLGAAPAEDIIANPEFISWSKHKTGATVTFKSVTTTAGRTSEVILTCTLIEVGNDKLVVECKSVVKENGMEFKSQPVNRDVPKTISLPNGVKREDFAVGKPPDTTEEGTEPLKVGDTELETKWYKYSADVAGTKTEAKMWVSEKIPGGMVKTEMETTGVLVSTIKMELIEVKKP